MRCRNASMELQKKKERSAYWIYRTFREGDKILQLKNQPDDDVYNGDIGRLIEIVPSKGKRRS
jgi:ATP-dependent exoDNAse (exonuclease V) alpha subunit